MKFRTALTSRLLLDSTSDERKCTLELSESAESGTQALCGKLLTAEKEKPSETLTERFREPAVSVCH